MRISSGFRAALIALTALTGVSLASTARADEGTIRISVVKAGWVIGGSGGSGVLNFHGRTYPLQIGGISYGIVFGASQTDLRGRVRNIRRPSDVAGVYGAAGAGLAVGRGASAIVLTNQNGAILELSGRQVGLIANADLSGLAITMR
jgi:lipid-binding SYLF domain-containing protein